MTQPPILLTDSAPRSKALNNELSVLYLNARSVKSVTRTRNKLHQLKDAVSMGNFTIIAITETWLDSRVNDSELIDSSYSVYRRDREDVLGDKTGGGVALCISNDVFSCRRKDLEPSDEVVICELKPENHSKILIVLACRPPSDDINKFLDTMNPVFKICHDDF